MASSPRTRLPGPPSTLVEALVRRAERTPDRPALRFLADGETLAGTLTYAELDRRARAFAAVLADAGARGERVALLLQPGLEYVSAFYGALYAGATVVPAYPDRPGRPSAALDAMLADARARFAVVADPAQAPVREGLTAIIVGDVTEAAGDDFRPLPVRADRLALLQYTSGSTSAPRAAMLDHSRLVLSALAVAVAMDVTEGGRGVTWLPPYHDMGMFGGMAVPVLAGVETFLMAPRAFLQRPARWVRAMSEAGAGWSGGPNFAYDLLVSATTEEERAGLDLSGWRTAVNGAETIRPETVERFVAAFGPHGFRRTAFVSMYGLAEGGLVAARRSIVERAFDIDALAKGTARAARPRPVAERGNRVRGVVDSGPPEASMTVAIVDLEAGRALGPYRVGEIWVSGPGVARGYWRRAAESRRILRARLPGDAREYARTGDLGFLRNGHVFVTGRLKELIIVAGRNHDPLDIERTVEASHPAIRRGGVAAFALDGHGTERVGVVAEIDRRAQGDPAEILTAIRRAVADEHELGAQQVALVGQGRLPRTTSGKTQRWVARDRLLGGELQVIAGWTAGQDPRGEALPDAGSRGSTELADAPRTEAPPEPLERGPAPGPAPAAATIEAWLAAHIAERLGHEPAAVDRRAPFLDFGLASVEATALAADLATWLGRPLSPTLTWEHPTIERLAAFLAEGGDTVPDPFVTAPQEPIAIVGVGLRMPGAGTFDEFRELLLAGRDAIREVPPERWDVGDLHDPTPGTPGKLVSLRGGFIDGVELFDPQFFNISPREAARMDPQQRLLLETTEEALEHAGIASHRLAGTRTGVFVGVGGWEYSQLQLGEAVAARTGHQSLDAYSMTGNAHSIAANRISFLYDLRGPSLALDTACSSSAVAIHLAVRSLLDRESDVGLAGGVNVLLTPDINVAFSQARMLSPNGRCASFDVSADGYVRSEGAGMVVLKRLSDAVRDGDRILALIRGTAVNQDGLTSGITAPSGRAQQEVVRTALARAGIEAGDLGLIEAHGTGTPLGDPIEVNALAQTVGPAREADHVVWLGSVKGNVGHLEVASAMAGVAKVIHELANGEVYPQLHFTALNPHIRMEGTPFRIPTAVERWPAGPKPRAAGVSSFGFGGTNAHLVLEEYREPIAPRPAVERTAHLVTFSARAEDGLSIVARHLAGGLTGDPSPPLGDLAYTANVGRPKRAHRAAIVAGTVEELRERLGRVGEGRGGAGIAMGRRPQAPPTVAFLFTGQGSQYRGMGRVLYDTSPTFHDALDRCAEILRPLVDRPLLGLLFPAPDEPDLLAETIYTQPALFALEYALAELWRSWGVRPDAVLGHSVGEYVAACVAGAFSLEDGLRLIAARGRLMQSVTAPGAMAAVLGPIEPVEDALADEPLVSIAGINGPTNLSISGDRDRVEAIVAVLRGRGLNAVTLNVSHAFHSPLIEPILDALEGIAAGIAHRPLEVALGANLSGQLLAPGATLDARYFRDHAREAVRFAEGIAAVHGYGAQVFVEVGPNPILIGMARRVLSAPAAWVPSLKSSEDDWRSILGGLGAAYAAGVDVDWTAFDRDYRRRIVTLPAYPFERSRQWYQAGPLSGRRSGAATAAGDHPVIRTVVDSPVPAVQARLGIDAPAYLSDHRVQGAAVVPATMHLEVMTALAGRADEPVALADIEFRRAVFLREGQHHLLQAMLVAAGGGDQGIQLHARADAGADAEWSLVATASLAAAGPDGNPDRELQRREEILARCELGQDPDELYERFRVRGVEYGPRFRGVRRMSWRAGEALGLVEAPDGVAEEVARYRLHPALLDACLHVFAAAVPGAKEAVAGGAFLPVGIGRLRVLRPPVGPLWVHATVGPGFTAQSVSVEGDLRITDVDGRLVAEVLGFRGQQLEAPGAGTGRDSVTDWFYEVRWDALDAPGPAVGPVPRGVLLLGDQDGLSTGLARVLRRGGHSVTVVRPGRRYSARRDRLTVRPGRREDIVRLQHALGDEAWAAVDTVVCLWPLDASWERPAGTASAAPGVPDEDPTAVGSLQVLHLIQALVAAGRGRTPRVVVVTRGAQSGLPAGDERGVLQAPVIGLARTARLEHAELRLLALDLDPDQRVDLPTLAADVAAVPGDREEPEIAYRAGRRLVPRLVRLGTGRAHADPDGAVDLGGATDETSSDAAVSLRAPAGHFRLEPETTGTLDGLALRPAQRRPPGPGEVEIAPVAAGLNFRDVMKALGIYPQEPGAVTWLGDEVAGRVLAVGEGVDLTVGQEVFGVAPGAFATVASTRAAYLLPKPADLTFEDAATLPITFLTALYALTRLGNLRAGERVLIHAAAGGVGQAAIQVAQAIGAEIYATASAPKRDFVRSLGVEHVFDSRSLDFAADVREATGDCGVDVVLNSLAGEFIPASIALLAPGGRFLEIGKRDIFQNAKIGLWPFRLGLGFFSIDMDRIVRERPDVASELLAELRAGLADGRYRPLPRTVFPIASAVEGFRYLAAARGVGKVVISLADTPAVTDERAAVFSRGGTYLVTGGLRGLGGRVAEWMAGQGAGTLVLVGRDPASEAARETAARVEAAGGRAVLVAADIARRADVDLVVAGLAGLAPLRGVVHAAGVLADATLMLAQDAPFTSVFGPKALGAWHLHQATADRDLDFFVCFSSMAAQIGNPGQGNYSAANAFLDRLAWLRHTQGRPALTVNWGPWGDIGMSAVAEGQRVFDYGVERIAPDRGCEALGLLLGDQRPQAIVLPVDWTRFFERLPIARANPFLDELRFQADTGVTPEASGAALASLLALPAEERPAALQGFIRGELATVLQLDPDELPIDRPLNTVGLDSLMALELKNKVEVGLSVNLPIVSLIQGPTIEELSVELLRRIDERGTNLASAAGDAGGATNGALPADEMPSAEEIERLLARSGGGPA